MHVYVAINEERDYQDAKHGDEKHAVSEWLSIMGSYADKANEAFAKGGDDCLRSMLDNMRKIVASGVCCMEQHGVVSRSDSQPKCDVCGDTEHQHNTLEGYDHAFGGIESIPSATRRADLIKKLNDEFTPAGDAALSKLKADMPIMQSDFRKDIENTINRYSKENGSNTPDFIVAQYLVDCLGAYDKAVTAREKWYGREPKPVPHDPQCQSLNESLPGPCDCMPKPPSPVGREFFKSI